MKNLVRTSYLVIAIIGIITAVPILGSLVDVFKVLTLVLLGFSILILVKGKKGSYKKAGAVLMIISCCLSLVGALLIFSAMGSLTGVGSLGDTLTDEQAAYAVGSLIGGSMLGFIFSFPAWVLKIIAIIFSFIEYGNQKKSEDDK
ncbi:hypothetical protein ACIJEF_001260 [Enterococcus faecalis]